MYSVAFSQFFRTGDYSFIVGKTLNRDAEGISIKVDRRAKLKVGGFFFENLVEQIYTSIRYPCKWFLKNIFSTLWYSINCFIFQPVETPITLAIG